MSAASRPSNAQTTNRTATVLWIGATSTRVVWCSASIRCETSCHVPRVGMKPPHACFGTNRAVSHGMSSTIPGQMSSAPGGRRRRSSAAGTIATSIVSQASSSQPLSDISPFSGKTPNPLASSASSVRFSGRKSGVRLGGLRVPGRPVSR